MIVREIAEYKVVDATAPTWQSRQLDYMPVLAPLLNFGVEIAERRIVLVEPQGGTLGSPDPNAFMVMVPPNFTAGAIFGVELLGTDWDSEGFAVGDVVDMAMGPIITNSILLRATVMGISGTAATFRIDNIYNVVGTLNTQVPFPLVAFVVNEMLIPKAALLRAGDVGFISPLNGQPFYTNGHANHISVHVSAPSASTHRYNLRYYDAAQEAVIDSQMPFARNFRFITLSATGTQFYAYRTSLNSTTNMPTQAYPTRGKIMLEAEAPNPLRNISFETECLLLHPNRLGETTNFLTPGILTISGGTGSISAPSVPNPVRQEICLLGPDSHHSLPNVLSSAILTSPSAPPSLPNPRSGADYVGVVTGQVNDEWVAVMTNRVPSTEPVRNLQIITEGLEPARYDSIVLTTTEESARQAGVYTVLLYGIIGGRPVLLTSYELNISAAVPNPMPDRSNATKVLGGLFPFEYKLAQAFAIRTGNYDTAIFTDDPSLGTRTVLYVPIPSGQEAPTLPGFSQPGSGFLLDIWPFLDSPQSLVAQVICPDGTLLESAPEDMPQPRPDRQVSGVNETVEDVDVDFPGTPIERGLLTLYCRAALFTFPAGHTPLDQAMAFYEEDYDMGTVVESYGQDGSRIEIKRVPMSGYTYFIRVDKRGLPPGRYVVHVRSEIIHDGQEKDYESFLYEFTVRGPDEPSGQPIPQTKCKVNIPTIMGEDWGYIAMDGDRWRSFSGQINSCSLDRYCGCFEIVPVIPSDWIDIIGYFKGAVKGLPVDDNARHKARFRGRIIRLDDEYSTEDFVSSVYRQEDIVRAYAGRYQVEIFADTPCDLSNIDILKFAAWWEVRNRSNKMLPDVLYFLRPGEVSIADDGEHARVTITLKGLKWRDEYRRQG